MLQELFLIGVWVRRSAAIWLFWNIWISCSGISVKSQFLYALVFTAKYLDVFSSYHGAEIVVLYYSTLIAAIVLRKTYQRDDDIIRIETLIISCGMLAVLVNHDSSPLGMIKTFSVYLEAVAMVPQFQFVMKAKQIQPHMLFYISAMGVYVASAVAQCGYEYFYSGPYTQYTELHVAAGTVQLLLYCDFFLQILPWCWTSQVEERQSTVATIEADIESGIPGTSHLDRCVSTAVLMPESLVGVHNNKIRELRVNLPKNEEPDEK